MENGFKKNIAFDFAIKSIPYLFCILIVIVPLALSKDMWDGVIIEYATKTADFSGVKQLFYEAGWFLEYWQVVLVQNISVVLKINYHSINLVLVALALFTLVHETYLFARVNLKLGMNWAVAAALLTGVYPMWNALISSVLTFHIMCFAFGYCGVRLLHKKNRGVNIIGFLLIIISFSVNSLLVLLPVLSYYYDIIKKCDDSSLDNWRNLKSWLPGLKTIAVFLTGMILFTAIRICIPPQGLFEDYNSVTNILSFKGMVEAVFYLLNYATFLSIPALGLFIIVLIPWLLNRPETILYSTEVKEFKSSLKNFALCILMLSAIFPYIVVGKGSNILSTLDWSGRHSFILAPLLSVFTVSVLQYAGKRLIADPKIRKKTMALALSFIVLLQVCMLSMGFMEKLNRQIFDDQLTYEISKIQDKLPPGRIQIVGNGVPDPIIRSFESNYLLYKATGKVLWWSSVSESQSPEFEVPENLLIKAVYEKEYIFKRPNDDTQTIVTIYADQYAGPVNQLLNVVGIGKPCVKIVDITTK